MNTKKFSLSVVAYVVIVLFIAVVWHLVLFKDIYSVGMMRQEPIVALGLASMLIQGIIMATLYPRFSKRRDPVKDGINFGLIMGVFLGSYGVFADAGKYDVGPIGAYLTLETIYYLIQYTVVGAVIGLIYGRK